MARDQLQSVAQIREIMEGETAQAAEAMLLLRPRWKTADAVIDFIDTKLRPTGYRLVGGVEHSYAGSNSNRLCRLQRSCNENQRDSS